MPEDEEEVALAKIRNRYAAETEENRIRDAVLTLIEVCNKLMTDSGYDGQQLNAIFAAVAMTAKLCSTAELTPTEAAVISELFREMEAENRRDPRC